MNKDQMEIMPYSLLSCCGVELEYMLVSVETLNTVSAADKILPELTERTDIHKDTDVSNELVNHVIELKTDPPSPSPWESRVLLHPLLKDVTATLRKRDLGLLGTGMHPWMDPAKETELWPLENAEIYSWYHRTFNCFKHGFANLQSIHLNIPFQTDADFYKLHSAVRLLLPLIPALCASSPFINGHFNGKMDNRLIVYRDNQKAIPEITGKVIPETEKDRNAYEKDILQPLERICTQLNGDGLIESQWLNSRGAIARFDRGSIEIRLMDKQECLDADLAVSELVFRTVKNLTEHIWSDAEHQSGLSTDDLAEILLETAVKGDRALITHRDYLQNLGIKESSVSAGELWQHLARQAGPFPLEAETVLEALFQRGCLARRIMDKCRGMTDRKTLEICYKQLLDCETGNILFL